MAQEMENGRRGEVILRYILFTLVLPVLDVLREGYPFFQAKSEMGRLTH